MSGAIGNLKQNLAHSLEEYSKNPWSWNLETKANSGALPDTADLFSWFPPYFSSDFHEGATSGNRLLRGSFLNSKSLEIYLAVVFLHPFLGMDSDAWKRESRIPKSSLLVSILLVFSSFLLNPHQWKYHLPKNHLMWFTLQKTYPKRAEDGLFFPKEGGFPNDFLRQHFTRPIAHPIQVPSNPSSLPDHIVLAISTCQVSSNSSRVMPPEQSLSMIEKIWHLSWITAATFWEYYVFPSIARKNREGEKCWQSKWGARAWEFRILQET